MKKGKGLKISHRGGLLILISICFLLFSVSFVSAQTAPAYPKVLRVATLSPGSTLYAIGSGLSKIASEHSPITVMVVPNSTSSVIPSMLEQGTADLAVDTSQVFWQMYTGKVAPDPVPKGFPQKPPFPGNKNLRFLMIGPANCVGMLVRKDSGLKEIADLRGKIVPDWSANPALISLTLANLMNGGLTFDDVKMLPITEVVAGVKAVQEKRIDASTCAVGMGAIAEADTLVGVRFLRNSVDPERVKAGQRCTVGAYTVMVKAGTAAGVVEDTPIWGVPFGVLVTNRMADQVAYKLVETWWAYYREYGAVHPMLSQWTPEKFVSKNAVLPYHNGAVKFFKDKGVWTTDMEQVQNRFLKGN